MKRLYKLLPAFLAVLLFASCGANNNADKPQGGDDGDNPITVVIPGAPAADPASWELVLVNRDHPLSGELDIQLEAVRFGYSPMGYKVDSRIYGALEEMFAAAKEDGINLCLVSAYRSISKQQSLYDSKISYYMGLGYSAQEAATLTERVLSLPGCSEHHTGLAADITSEDWVRETGGSLTEGFADTAAGKWLALHSSEYGFILRYPKDKESVTGISFEPWHMRYVGRESAKYIHEHGLCLEEYIEYLNSQH